ncbi:hypothetical protein ACERCG_03715 [Mannheimia sp. E30BD]|uniref:hypothetical protein n=1 Tax=Mannheimia sp. E30BD TaxID=3278708 RepID=UPI00359E9123
MKTPTHLAVQLKTEAKAIEVQYGLSSNLQMGIRAATAALQGLATGNTWVTFPDGARLRRAPILICLKRLIILSILQILAVNQPLVLARVRHSRHREEQHFNLKMAGSISMKN